MSWCFTQRARGVSWRFTKDPEGVSWRFTYDNFPRTHRSVDKACQKDYLTSRRLAGAMEGFEGERISTPLAVE